MRMISLWLDGGCFVMQERLIASGGGGNGGDGAPGRAVVA